MRDNNSAENIKRFKRLRLGTEARQKMGRILAYMMDTVPWRDYEGCHRLIHAAWNRMNEDKEFCEQTELDLPLDGWA